MKKEFLLDRQGKTFVLFAGLLDAAHDAGLQGLATEVVTVNANLAVFKATATFKDGRVFTSHGDATPENVGRNIAPHFIRMADTRAKARALRDALNIGAASLEELGDDDHAPEPPRQRQASPLPNPAPRPPNLPAPQATEAPAPDPALLERQRQARAMNPPNAAAHKAGTGDIATPAQVRAIYLLGRDKQGMDDAAVDARAKELYGAPPADLTKTQASGFITALQGAEAAK